MNHQTPDWECKVGFSEILPSSLYLGGEDDIDDLLYGVEEARHLNGKGAFLHAPTPQIDVWIDLRDIRSSNRQVYLPDGIQYVSIPFHDGNLEEARTYLPQAKQQLTSFLEEGKRVLVTCHQGRSRSVMLVLWHLCERENSFLSAYWDLKGKRAVMEPDKRFQPLLNEWKEQYKSEAGNLW